MDNMDKEREIIIPCALKEGTWPLWTLVIMYFLTALASLLGVLIMIKTHKRVTLRALLLLASALFCGLRFGLTLISINNWEDHLFWLYLLNIYLPVYLQFWTVSLLNMFIARAFFVIRGYEQSVRSFLYPLYHACQFIILIICCIISWLMAKEYRHHPSVSTWDKHASLLVGIMYGLLLICGIAAYVHFMKIRLLLESAFWTKDPPSTAVLFTPAAALTTPTLSKQTTSLSTASKYLSTIRVFIIVYLTLFLLRSIWNILYFANSNPIQKKFSQWASQEDKDAYNLAFVAYYSIFEIFPTAIMVAFFAMSSRIRMNTEDSHSSGIESHTYHDPLLTSESSGEFYDSTNNHNVNVSS